MIEMKTAEEWVKIRKEMPLSVDWGDTKEVIDKEFATFIKQIQLDAWKQGMSDAANIVDKTNSVEHQYFKCIILEAKETLSIT